MNWGSFSEFLAMGGYAGYVWGSFGACAAAFVFETVFVKHRRTSVLRSLRRQVLANRMDQEIS